MIQAAKIIGTGLATTGLIGAGIGIGVVFGALLLISSLGYWLFKPNTLATKSLMINRPMPGVRCPACANRGVETWVLPGKHCPTCGHPC